MKMETIEDIIEQAKLNEPCPCKSGKAFGACCGSLEICDCKSGFIASDCCYSNDRIAPMANHKKRA